MLIVILTAVAAVTVVAFARVRAAAAVLLVPYLAWLLLATALNFAILVLNGP